MIILVCWSMPFKCFGNKNTLAGASIYMTKNFASSTARKRNRRAERLGYIRFDNHDQKHPCRVRDFDETGALLTMDGWMGIPATFSLMMDHENGHYDCRIISHRGNCARVSFEPALRSA